MKKVFSILVVMLLTLALLAMPAAADDTAVRVYIDGPAQIKAGETAAVSLYVNGNTASGGVFGIIHYDPAALTYEGVSFRDDVIALDNEEIETYRIDETAGTVKFLLVSNVTGGNAPADAWMTVNFTLKSTTVGASATVTLSDVKASDMTGEEDVTATVIENDTVTLVAESNLYTDLLGATIKTDIVKQGIRFESSKTDLTMTGLTEAGVVMLPTALLYEGQDLTKTTVGKGGATPAIASVTNADALARIAQGESLYATLTKGTTGGRANVSITARSYVVINGVTIYSHNDITDRNILLGEAEKTLVSVAQAIAATEIANASKEGQDINTLGDLLTKTTLTDDEVTTLLTFCRDNISCL